MIDDQNAKFLCLNTAECPGAVVCPTRPTDAGGCDDLPGFFGHPNIKVEAGRPNGCRAWLPYENPFYPGDKQFCDCSTLFTSDGQPHWLCPL